MTRSVLRYNQVPQSRVVTISAPTATYNIELIDYLVDVKATISNAVAVTLPIPDSGATYVIKDGGGNAAANNITINPNGLEKIDGVAEPLIINVNYTSVTLQSNGTDWYIV